MRIEPLGERALILRDLGAAPAHLAAAHLREKGFSGLVEVVASYQTVGLYFEGRPAEERDIRRALEDLDRTQRTSVRAHEIPICYELGLDLREAAKQLGISVEALIDAHLGKAYTCFAIGFSPGFPYLGYLDDAVSGLPRLPQPRTRVEHGSVGITGRQCGVYPQATPGGWWLIGKTPLQIMNLDDAYFPIEAGDQIRFRRTDEDEFKRLEGERL